MKSIVSCLLATALFCICPDFAHAAALRAVPAEVVTPEPALAEFVAQLHGLAQSTAAARSPKAREAGYLAIDALIAPDLKGFSRTLDPLAKWGVVKPEGKDGLDKMASYMIEQDELPDGARQPDYREKLVKELVDRTAPDVSFGRLADLPGALCTPARLGFDSKKVAAFAKAHDTDAYSLRVAPAGLGLRAAARKTEASGPALPTGTILALDLDAPLIDGWARVVTSDGVAGWAADTAVADGLSQMHICFAKHSGGYQLVGFFAFGL